MALKISKEEWERSSDLGAELRLVRAERDRAQRDCERMGQKNTALRAALLRIASIIETQREPDIGALHDVAREALNR